METHLKIFTFQQNHFGFQIQVLFFKKSDPKMSVIFLLNRLLKVGFEKVVTTQNTNIYQRQNDNSIEILQKLEKTIK